jgi:hypothetical protein
MSDARDSVTRSLAEWKKAVVLHRTVMWSCLLPGAGLCLGVWSPTVGTTAFAVGAGVCVLASFLAERARHRAHEQVLDDPRELEARGDDDDARFALAIHVDAIAFLNRQLGDGGGAK